METVPYTDSFVIFHKLCKLSFFFFSEHGLLFWLFLLILFVLSFFPSTLEVSRPERPLSDCSVDTDADNCTTDEQDTSDLFKMTGECMEKLTSLIESEQSHQVELGNIPPCSTLEPPRLCRPSQPSRLVHTLQHLEQNRDAREPN